MYRDGIQNVMLHSRQVVWKINICHDSQDLCR
jgi:hypothetical protein